jgi:hypothetical protein
MKKMTEKKLELSKETLTNLQNKDLEAVAGGIHRQTLSGCD